MTWGGVVARWIICRVSLTHDPIPMYRACCRFTSNLVQHTDADKAVLTTFKEVGESEEMVKVNQEPDYHYTKLPTWRAKDGITWGDVAGASFAPFHSSTETASDIAVLWMHTACSWSCREDLMHPRRCVRDSCRHARLLSIGGRRRSPVQEWQE